MHRYDSSALRPYIIFQVYAYKVYEAQGFLTRHADGKLVIDESKTLDVLDVFSSCFLRLLGCMDQVRFQPRKRGPPQPPQQLHTRSPQQLSKTDKAFSCCRSLHRGQADGAGLEKILFEEMAPENDFVRSVLSLVRAVPETGEVPRRPERGCSCHPTWSLPTCFVCKPCK